MPESRQLTPEQQYQQYLICGDVMRLIRGLTIACAQIEYDDGISACAEMLLSLKELRSAFEPEEFIELEFADE